MDFDIGIWAILGFCFAAYAVVGNDALQTLGAFINSNQRLHWFWLFLFAGTILLVTFYYGLAIYDGDPSWGRLANVKKYPIFEPEWYHTLPPLALLLLTRFGVPVSTSFMVLTIFATMGGLNSMLQKSLIGYGAAFVAGGVLYLLLAQTVERFFRSHEPGAKAPWGLATTMGVLVGATLFYLPSILNIDLSYSIRTCVTIAIGGVIIDVLASMAVLKFERSTTAVGAAIIPAAVAAFSTFYYLPVDYIVHLGPVLLSPIVLSAILGLLAFVLCYALATRISSGRIVYWIILQWITTAYLWGIWLIQDFANIFVFLPRKLTSMESFLAISVVLILLGFTFANKGGPVQKILKAKTGVSDIRSATLINFTFATLLFFFKEVSDIPMSTTWVFLGLIAGREFAFSLMLKAVSLLHTIEITLSDLSKAFIGLVISIDLARGLPPIAKMLSGELALGGLWADIAPTQPTAIFIITANLMLIPVFAFLFSKSKPAMMALSVLFAGVGWAFFTFPVA